MPNIMSRLFCEGVTDKVVAGQTRTSPPRGRCRIVVSEPAVTEEPAAKWLASITVDPASALTGTTAASELSEKPVTVSCAGEADFFPALMSSGGLRRTIRRWPPPSQEWP